MKKILLGLIIAFNFIGIAFAQKIPTMEFFYGATCPHCHDEKAWFPELKKAYPNIQIKEYEIQLDLKNQALFQKRMSELGASASSVPTNVIGDQVLIGFSKEEILTALEKKYGPPASKINIDEREDGWKKYLESSWPVMSFSLGILDGFNPCAMWTLFVLLGFLLSMESKKKRWLIGGIFVASSAIIYFGALFAYLIGFEGISAFVSGPIMLWIFKLVGAIAIFTGIMSIRHFRKAGINCEVRDSESKKSFREKLSAILDREEIFFVIIGIIGLAFSVNAIELICSFAIPTTFTASLVSLELPFWQQIMGLVIYDVAYILDDVIVLFLALWTMDLKVLSPKIVQMSHLLGGIILLILGTLLILDPELLGKFL